MGKNQLETNSVPQKFKDSKLKKFIKKIKMLKSKISMSATSPNSVSDSAVPLIAQNTLVASNDEKFVPSKEFIEKVLLEKLRKPQSNHLLKKLVSHVADKISKEPKSEVDGSQITMKMIKESLHSETVNFGRKNNFTMEEDQLILNMIMNIGKNWKAIASILKDKSPNMIKNRYYTYLKKKFDQTYHDIISLKSSNSSNTTNDSVKMEEEKEQFLSKDANKNLIEINQNKIKWLHNLIKFNRMLDQEKKKIMMNIAELQRNILIEKGKKMCEYLNASITVPCFFQNINNRNCTNVNPIAFYQQPMYNFNKHQVMPNILMDQTPVPHQNVSQQINLLENVIKDALQQLNQLKSVCGNSS